VNRLENWHAIAALFYIIWFNLSLAL
jgi:hypothetical protein